MSGCDSRSPILEPELQERLRGLRLVFFDFDGVFTDNAVYVDQQGQESVRCTRADGLGLERLRGVGVEAYIVSTETNTVVAARAAKLRLRFVQSVTDKAKVIARIATEMGVDLAHTAFVGNDINDLAALRCVGVSMAVADAEDEIADAVMLRTKRKGGHGAVREICDLIVRLRYQASRP